MKECTGGKYVHFFVASFEMWEYNNHRNIIAGCNEMIAERKEKERYG